MYTEDDLRTAVTTGAISAEAADALRKHVATQRGTLPADAEHFRLITGFNDIFVSIGVVIMLVAMGAIGQAIASGLFPAPVWEPGVSDDWWSETRSARNFSQGMGLLFTAGFVAATTWPLAEFFTRKRRMALPSIILLVAFLGGIMTALSGIVMTVVGEGGDTNEAVGFVLLALSALLTAGAAWLHWKRFMVPITIAGGVAAVAATAILLLLAALEPMVGDTDVIVFSLVFVAGLVIFGLAMRWDTSDPERSTRRSDVAFWLHLLAAPMIAHPIFWMIGVTEGDAIGIGAAIGVLAVYIAFGLVALAVDRRALLVSALAYVLIALTFLFREFGAVELNFALTALVIGSALLTLSAMWGPIRAAVVSALPGDIRQRLPATA